MMAAAVAWLALLQSGPAELSRPAPAAEQDSRVRLSLPVEDAEYAAFLRREGFSEQAIAILSDETAQAAPELEAAAESLVREAERLRGELVRLSNESSPDLDRIEALLRRQDEISGKLAGIERSGQLQLLRRLPPADRRLYLRDVVRTTPEWLAEGDAAEPARD